MNSNIPPLLSLLCLDFDFENTSASNRFNMGSRPQRLRPQLLPNGAMDLPFPGPVVPVHMFPDT